MENQLESVDKAKEKLNGSGFYLLLVVYSSERHLIFLIQIIYEIKAKARVRLQKHFMCGC